MSSDLTGQRFGRLQVLSRVSGQRYNDTFYVVRCDCGVTKTMARRRLPDTKSCGCLLRAARARFAAPSRRIADAFEAVSS